MKNIFVFCVGFLLNSSVFGQINQDLKEQLILFSQKEDTHFVKNTLPKIKEYCIEKGIELIEKDVEKGTPESIVSTPAIVYQNYRGRSIYSSRYAEFTTIKNFIRTARVVPQTESQNCIDDVLVWKNGQTKIAGKLKITNLKGNIPKEFSSTAFKSKITQSLTNGMTDFDFENQVCLLKTDRLFYLDIHPYQSREGQLFLSMEMYSKFSCKTPVFSKMIEPVSGNFENFEELAAEVGFIFQQEIYRQMKTSEIGDAFSTISNNTPIVTWGSLGLALPDRPKSTVDLVSIPNDFPTEWLFKSGIDEETPIVQFRFMEPLDRYVGEIRKIKGELTLSDKQVLQSGSFEADMQSLTMGMEDFDKNVLTKYIKAFKFPKSFFSFSNDLSESPLQWGETTFLKVSGTFELMKKEKEVEVAAQITPVISEEGAILLQVSASFSLNIVDDFGIKGSDGPNPARKTMLFDLNFLMKSTEITN